MPGSLHAARQKLPRSLTHREAVLDELLDHLVEVRQPCYATGSSEGDGSGVIGMPRAWRHPSYRKLETILAFGYHLVTFNQASPDFRRNFLSLEAWYLRCIRIPKVSEPKTVRRGKEIVDLPRTVRMHVVRKADPALVLIALEWVDGHFPGEPFVPDEILEPVAA